MYPGIKVWKYYMIKCNKVLVIFTGIMSFLQKWHNTVIPSTGHMLLLEKSCARQYICCLLDETSAQLCWSYSQLWPFLDSCWKWIMILWRSAWCMILLNSIYLLIYFNIFIQDNKFSKAVFQLGPVWLYVLLYFVYHSGEWDVPREVSGVLYASIGEVIY